MTLRAGGSKRIHGSFYTLACMANEHHRRCDRYLRVLTAALMTVIPIMAAIPAMVMLDPAARASPIAINIQSAFMARSNPVGALIRRTSPIPIVPAVMAADRIPVALHPNIPRTGRDRADRDDSWRWRGSDVNSDRYAAKSAAGGEEKRC